MSSLAFLIIVFIFNADTDNLTTISPEELFEMIRTVDFVAIIQLPEFWSMALAPFRWKMELSDFLSFYVLFSVLLFGLGLLVIHIYIQRLNGELLSMLSLLMGMTHILIAKILLTFITHEALIGPFLASGIFGVLYYSLIAMILGMYAVGCSIGAK